MFDSTVIDEALNPPPSTPIPMRIPMKAYDLNTTFTFGKYKGKTLQEVIESDESYVNWCICNLDHYYITESTLKEIEHAIPAFSLNSQAIEKLAEKRGTYKADSTYEEYAEFERGIESTTHEYGGYNGFDDLAIEVAFEGDPENTWNVE